MKFIFLLAYLVNFCSFLNGQNDTLLLKKNIQIQGTKIFVDNFENLYILNNYEFQKYDNKHQLLSTYCNKSLGDPSGIDVSNSLKILVFYSNRNRIVFLDNMLTQHTSIVNIEEKDLFDMSVAASSIQNGFWLFDNFSQQLIFFDFNLNEKYNSVSVNQLTNAALSPQLLVEKNNYIYLLDKKQGLFIFNSFADYCKHIPIKNAKKVWIEEEYYVFFMEQKLKFIHKNMLEEFEINIPTKKNIIDACKNSNNFYILTKEGIEIFQIKMQ